MGHRFLRMNLRFGIVPVIFAVSLAAVSAGQTAVPDAQPGARGSSTVLPSAMLQPVLSDVQSSTSGLNISRWKAPSSVRDAAQENVDSIQRDLGNTLPGLIAQADAAPGSVPASFAVYRNIDALYDVLLRVSESADLAAPENEADSVDSSLQKLEVARAQLGDSILRISQHDEAQVVALEAAVRSAKAAAAAQPKPEIVVDDGPANIPAKGERVRKKTPPKKPAPKPPPGATGANSAQ
jgi:hypothetical protein